MIGLLLGAALLPLGVAFGLLFVRVDERLARTTAQIREDTEAEAQLIRWEGEP